MLASGLSGTVLYGKASMKEKAPETHSVETVKVQPDGERLVELLRGSKGTMTQSELVRKSGMDKLRVSRAIKKLERLHVVRKHPYGMTNNITLEHGVHVD